MNDADRVKRQKAVAIIKALRREGVGDGLARNLDSVSSGELYGYLLRRGWMWARNQMNFVKQKELPMGGMMDKVKIEQIRLDGGTQSRAMVSDETVNDYAEAMKEGAQFPPVIVFYDGQSYWLADGFHRVAAAKKAELTEIAADVRQGAQRDAVLMSVSVNANHGLRRTQADKRRAIEVLLRDEEWRGWSDREIARRVSVDHKTVAAVRADLTQRGEIPMLDTRKVARGETEYTVTKNSYPPTPAAELDVETARQIAVKAVMAGTYVKPEPHRELLQGRLQHRVHWPVDGNNPNEAPVWFGANTVEINGEKLKVAQNQIAVELSTVNGVGLYRFDAYQLFDWSEEREALLQEVDAVRCLLRMAVEKIVYVQDTKLARRLVKYGLGLTSGGNNQLTITADGRERAEVFFQQNPLRALERDIILSVGKKHYSMVPFSGEEALIDLYDDQEKDQSWTSYHEYQGEYHWLAEFAQRGYAVVAQRETRGGYDKKPIYFYTITPAGCALIGRDPLPELEPLPELPYHSLAHLFISPDATFRVQVGDRIQRGQMTGVVTELREYPDVVFKLDVGDDWSDGISKAFDHEVTILKRAGEYQDEMGGFPDDHVFATGDRVEYRDWGMHENAEGKREYGVKWVPVVVTNIGQKRIQIRHTDNHRGNGVQWAERRNLRPIAAQVTQPAAPAGEPLKPGDKVMTRTGHPGEIVSISGRIAQVQTAHMLSPHKLETLTKVDNPEAAPTSDVDEKRHNNACFMAAWYALLSVEEHIDAVTEDEKVLVQHLHVALIGVKDALAYRLELAEEATA